MGQPKQLLPWGPSTVLATVVEHLAAAGAQPILCVVGHRGAEMTAALIGTDARVLPNPDYVEGEMLSSYRAGITALSTDNPAIVGTLLALGDQPHIPAAVIRAVIDQGRATPDAVVIPSYQMRRGHPFYLPRRLWPDLLALTGDETLRTLLHRHAQEVVYVDVATDAILRDIDTPSDYQSLAQQHG